MNKVLLFLRSQGFQQGFYSFDDREMGVQVYN